MDVLVEDFSTDQVSGRVRGLYLTVMNGGLLLAPIFSTRTLALAGYSGIFTILGIGYMVVLVVVLLGLRDHRTIPLPRIASCNFLVSLHSNTNCIVDVCVSNILRKNA
jgi:hypothetical protein